MVIKEFVWEKEQQEKAAHDRMNKNNFKREYIHYCLNFPEYLVGSLIKTECKTLELEKPRKKSMRKAQKLNYILKR